MQALSIKTKQIGKQEKYYFNCGSGLTPAVLKNSKEFKREKCGVLEPRD